MPSGQSDKDITCCLIWVSSGSVRMSTTVPLIYPDSGGVHATPPSVSPIAPPTVNNFSLMESDFSLKDRMLQYSLDKDSRSH